MSVSSGLNRRIMIEKRPPALNAMNERLTAWELFEEVWAGIKDLSGSEFVRAGGTQNVVSTKIRIRQLSGLTDQMRVVEGSDVYKIETILREDGGFLLLMCSKGATDG